MDLWYKYPHNLSDGWKKRYFEKILEALPQGSVPAAAIYERARAHLDRMSRIEVGPSETWVKLATGGSSDRFGFLLDRYDLSGCEHPCSTPGPEQKSATAAKLRWLRHTPGRKLNNSFWLELIL